MRSVGLETLSKAAVTNECRPRFAVNPCMAINVDPRKTDLYFFPPPVCHHQKSFVSQLSDAHTDRSFRGRESWWINLGRHEHLLDLAQFADERLQFLPMPLLRGAKNSPGNCSAVPNQAFGAVNERYVGHGPVLERHRVSPGLDGFFVSL